MKKLFLFCFLLYINSFTLDFDKVVLWGHKLHSHTHSYIHWGFYRAFKHLGYEVYWLDHHDDVSNMNLKGALFITEGQADQGIPLKEEAFYILHNCMSKKYKSLFDKNRCILLQVYTHDCKDRKLEVIDDCILCNVNEKIIYMPWATDLLPHEIDIQKKNVALRNNNKEIYFIGSIGAGGGGFGNRDEFDNFIRACAENHVSFKSALTCKSMEENIALIKKSYIAPAIQGPWQCKQGYIPCRIFKNISYGHVGATNNETVYKLFNKKIVYNSNSYRLFYDTKKKMETMPLQELYELMDFVKQKHTYINRIKTLLDFFDRVRGSLIFNNHTRGII